LSFSTSEAGSSRHTTALCSRRKGPSSNPGEWLPDEKGEYFIDRSNEGFERILDYLSTGELLLKGLNEDYEVVLRDNLFPDNKHSFAGRLSTSLMHVFRSNETKVTTINR
jgi:hypothetical protein